MARPVGSQNKVTVSVKTALLDAFERKGGVPALLAWAEKEPNEFYKLWAKLLPKDVNIDASVSVLSPEERQARIAALLGQK